MARVVRRNRALDDIDQIIRYIGHRDPAAAGRMGQRLFDLDESLMEFPRRGRMLKDGTYEMPTVPPYVLRCEMVEDCAFVLSVRHGARQPAGD